MSARYAVYATDPYSLDAYGRPCRGRLEWAGEAADEDAAIRAFLREVGEDYDEHASGLIAELAPVEEAS